MTVQDTSRKIMRKTSLLMSKFNLQLLKTWILNFAHVHSKGRKLGMFILFQSKFPTNSPISHRFPTNWPISIFKRSDTRTPQDLLLGKNCFVLGLLARDIANHSFEHTFDPGLKHLEWKIDYLRSFFTLSSGWSVWRPVRQVSLATLSKFADNLILSPYHSKYLHHDLHWRQLLVPMVPKWGR